MHIDLKNRHAIISGSTAGIGYELPRAWPLERMLLSPHGRPAWTRLRKRSARKASDARTSGVAADLLTRAGIDRLIERVPEIDILVSCLGKLARKSCCKTTDEDWLRFFNNADRHAPLLLLRAGHDKERLGMHPVHLKLNGLAVGKRYSSRTA